MGTPITYVLEYIGADYQEVFYNQKKLEDNTWDRSEWTSVKPTRPEDFPNLPYFIDGDVKMTQTNAIISYICRKEQKLLPNNFTEQWKCDMMVGVTGDFRHSWAMMCYHTGDKEKWQNESLPNWLDLFDKYFTENKFCAGDSLTHVDFMLFEILDMVGTTFPGVYEKHEKLKNFWENILNIEQIQKYRNSDKFSTYPINGWAAKVGGAQD